MDLHCVSVWRLVEETFTVDEVKEMLDGLQAVVRAEVEMELINTAHTNVLLLRQLFSQAEKFYLRLQSDISELENRWAEQAVWQEVKKSSWHHWEYKIIPQRHQRLYFILME